jgi:recombination protein RecR
MRVVAEPVSRLVDEFSRLPGIGPKTAQRLTYHLLRMPAEQARALADAINQVKDRVRLCSVCFNVTESDPCDVCRSETRDRSIVCVVEEPLDVLALERTGSFNGIYHVLHGALSPVDGIGPSELKIDALIKRVEGSVESGVKSGAVREVILATNPNVEGEATASFVARLLAPSGVRLTRLARGLPVGGDLEYADDVTLKRAIDGRSAF